MTTRYGNFKRRGIRRLRSAGVNGLKCTAIAAEKAAVGLFRWAATDHSGMARAMDKLPKMGIPDTLKFIWLSFCFTLGFALLRGIAIFFTIAIWIPFLLWLLF